MAIPCPNGCGNNTQYRGKLCFRCKPRKAILRTPIKKKYYTIPRTPIKKNQKTTRKKRHDKIMRSLPEKKGICSGCGQCGSTEWSHVKAGRTDEAMRFIMEDCRTCHHKYDAGSIADFFTLNNWQVRLVILFKLKSPKTIRLINYAREQNEFIPHDEEWDNVIEQDNTVIEIKKTDR